MPARASAHPVRAGPMRALIHPSPGVTTLVTRPDPVPAQGELLVEVLASGMNRADLLQRDGRYPAPPGWPADIPGLEFAGRVLSCGDGVREWQRGDRVMGLVGGGAHASRALIAADAAMPIPAALDEPAAAAIPEAFLTAWDALMLRARAVPGERVLVHAVGSGIGTAAVQLARMLGLEAIGTSRTPSKLDRAAALGAARGVLTTASDWPARVGHVDVILDTLGAAVFEQNIELLAHRGRLVLIGTLTGGTAHTFELGQALRRRLEIIGTVMRSRPAAERAQLVAQFRRDVLPAFSNGTLEPVIDTVFPASEFDDAYDCLASNHTFGKVILNWAAER